MTISPQVAVVGAGPAGLAAAIEAARTGATVHFYDERPVLGGPTYAHAAQSALIPDVASTRIVPHQCVGAYRSARHAGRRGDP